MIVGATAFAYVGGWFGPRRRTPGRMLAALSDRGGDPLGHRRNQAKGVCFFGTFQANGAGGGYSTAPMLVAGIYSVIGRFAIAGGDPNAPDIMMPSTASSQPIPTRRRSSVGLERRPGQRVGMNKICNSLNAFHFSEAYLLRGEPDDPTFEPADLDCLHLSPAPFRLELGHPLHDGAHLTETADLPNAAPFRPGPFLSRIGINATCAILGCRLTAFVRTPDASVSLFHV